MARKAPEIKTSSSEASYDPKSLEVLRGMKPSSFVRAENEVFTDPCDAPEPEDDRDDIAP